MQHRWLAHARRRPATPDRRRTRRPVGVTAAVLLAMSCGGSGRGGTSPVTPDGGLPRDVCALVSRFDRVTDRLTGSEVFDRDAEQLAEDFATRRRVLGEIADLATGDLARRLRRQLRSQEAVDEAVVARWDERRAAIAAGHVEGTWPLQVLDDVVVQRSDGVEVDADGLVTLAGNNHLELDVRCQAPEAAGRPDEETSEDPPPGRLLLVGWVPVTGQAGGGHNALVTADPAGGDVRPLPDPAPWQDLVGLDARPVGDHQVVVVARNGDEFGLVIVDHAGTVEGVAGRSPSPMDCPSWHPAGDRILVVDRTSDADQRRLHVVDVAASRIGGPLDLPFAAVGCSAFLGDDRLVVADAARTIDGDRGVWTVGLDGSDPRQVYAPEGCRTQVGSVDPAGARVAVSQVCADPRATGLWVVDLDTGHADHVATAYTGPAKWSPDGKWLVFSLYPLLGDRTSTIWAARADGRQLRQVVDDPSFSPVWLPPG